MSDPDPDTASDDTSGPGRPSGPAGPNGPATRDEQADGEDRSLSHWALDALVYAPAGLLLTAVEDLPGMAVKGRARLESQVSNARVLGQLAVTYGRKDLEKRLARLTSSQDEPPVGEPPAPEPEPELAPEPTSRSARTSPGTGTSDAVTPAPRRGAPPTDANLAIPEYDTLSASQVVRRLDGLGPQELEAVYHHEAATRGRRTILHRAQQLLGSEDVPGR